MGFVILKIIERVLECSVVEQRVPPQMGKTQNFYVKATGEIYNNQTLHCSSVISFEAGGKFCNLGGAMKADEIAVIAHSILNLSPDTKDIYAKLSTSISKRKKHPLLTLLQKNGRTLQPPATPSYPLPTGKIGEIAARNVFLESNSANIENKGGRIVASEFTKITSSNDVINTCKVNKGLATTIDAGIIAGGSGINTENVGLCIIASGKVIADASTFASAGVKYIEADLGFNFKARRIFEGCDKKTVKKWYGKKKTHIEPKIRTIESSVLSNTNTNILCSQHGGLQSVSSRFSSPGGTKISVSNDVQLSSLKSTLAIYDSKSSLWGLKEKRRTEIHQVSTPTIFLNGGTSSIKSTYESVDATGALFIESGNLNIEAYKRIKFGLDVLNHKIIDKSSVFSLAVPGIESFKAWKSGAKVKNIIFAGDETLAEIRTLNSKNKLELAANAANLSLNVYNTTNNIMRGIANNSLTKEALARYGLGGANGFQPSATLTLTQTKVTSNYQTLSEGGAFVKGNITLKANDGIDFENGVEVHADGDIEIDSKEIIATAAKLQFSEEQQTTSASVSFNQTSITNVSGAYAKATRKGTNYLNAKLSANNQITVHNKGEAINLVKLDGANIHAEQINGDITKLEIIDKQDEVVSRDFAASASACGQMSYHQGKGISQKTSKSSSLEMNNNSNLHINEAFMLGGKIIVQDGSEITIDNLRSQNLVDQENYHAAGLSLNVNDLSRLIDQEPCNQTGENAIATIKTNYDKMRYKNEHTPVLFADEKSKISIIEKTGAIHCESIDSSHVIKDEQLNLNINIPLTNRKYIEQSFENFHEAAKKLFPEHNFTTNENAPISQITFLDTIEDESNVEDILNADSEEDFDSINENLESDANKDISDENAFSAINEISGKTLEQTLAELMLPEKTLSLIPNAFNKEFRIHEDKEKNKFNYSQRFKLISLETLKTISNHTWDHLLTNLQLDNVKFKKLFSSSNNRASAGIKAYIGSKKILFQWTLNLAGTSIESVPSYEALKKATTLTIGEVTFDLVVASVAKGASGYVGGVMFCLNVADAFYDPKHIDDLNKQTIKNMYEAQALIKDRHYLAAAALHQTALIEYRGVALTKVIHHIAQIPRSIGNGLEYASDKISHLVKDKKQKISDKGFFASRRKNDSEKLNDLMLIPK